jgi:hypothetical protein
MQIQENPPPVSPGVREAKRSIPLFTFCQVGIAKSIHRVTRITVDLLSVTPEQYAQVRSKWLARLKEEFVRDGKPKFCKNPQCLIPIPLGHKYYCSEKCNERSRRTHKPKSTARVKRSYQKRIPFASFGDIPVLPKVE